MPKVAIVTDSTTSLPTDLAAKHSIYVIPNILIWEGREYRDGVDIQPAEFYTRLPTARSMPTTAAANVADFVEIFRDLTEQGFDVLGIFPPPTLSAIIQNARIAIQSFDSGSIKIINTHTVIMQAGWAVLLAARVAAQGASLVDCANVAQQALANGDGAGVINNLKYLHRGGRIGGAQRFLGTALQLKPILKVVDGYMIGIERVRTRKKAIRRLLNMTEAWIAGRTPVYLTIYHANDPDAAANLLEQAVTRFQPIEHYISEASPIVAAHLGPGALGLAFVAGIQTPESTSFPSTIAS